MPASSASRRRSAPLGGFRLSLLTGSLAAAATSWLVLADRNERGSLTALALAAALLVLVSPHNRSPDRDDAADGEQPTAQRARPGRLRRGSRRPSELALRLTTIEKLLDEQAQTLAGLTETLRHLGAGTRSQQAELERRLTELETDRREGQAALHLARQHHQRRLHHLRETLQAHNDDLAALEHTLDAAAPSTTP
jgi:hypothetical protein